MSIDAHLTDARRRNVNQRADFSRPGRIVRSSGRAAVCGRGTSPHTASSRPPQPAADATRLGDVPFPTTGLDYARWRSLLDQRRLLRATNVGGRDQDVGKTTNSREDPHARAAVPRRRPRPAPQAQPGRAWRPCAPTAAPGVGPTWYLLEDDDRVLLIMDDTRVRLKHLRRRPPVTPDRARPGGLVHPRLPDRRVEEMTPTRGLRDIDRLSRTTAATRTPTARSAARSAAWIAVDRWHG